MKYNYLFLTLVAIAFTYAEMEGASYSLIRLQTPETQLWRDTLLAKTILPVSSNFEILVGVDTNSNAWHTDYCSADELKKTKGFGHNNYKTICFKLEMANSGIQKRVFKGLCVPHDDGIRTFTDTAFMWVANKKNKNYAAPYTAFCSTILFDNAKQQNDFGDCKTCKTWYAKQRKENTENCAVLNNTTIDFAMANLLSLRSYESNYCPNTATVFHGKEMLKWLQNKTLQNAPKLHTLLKANKINELFGHSDLHIMNQKKPVNYAQEATYSFRWQKDGVHLIAQYEYESGSGKFHHFTINIGKATRLLPNLFNEFKPSANDEYAEVAAYSKKIVVKYHYLQGIKTAIYKSNRAMYPVMIETLKQ